MTKKECPLAWITWDVDLKGITECFKSGCAWYENHRKRCSLVVIARALAKISEDMEILVRCQKKQKILHVK